MTNKAIIAVGALVLVACLGLTGAGERLGTARMDPEPRFVKAGEVRTFSIEYTARVADVPPGAKLLRVWVPVPQDSPLQTISEVSFDAPSTPSIREEPRYGNRIAYFEIADPPRAVEIGMSFRCSRREHVARLARLRRDGAEDAESHEAFLRPGRLVVVDDRIRQLAAEITRGRRGTLAKARAIYDYVLDHMTYDKSGEGWGRGDSVYACEVGRGNCTDFHALFNALCRAEGIASGFQIGLYLPYERGGGSDVGGYHCWALFRVPGKTWVPVDISEADRLPQRRDYFFGAHTANRVTLSTGRDIVLAPPQAGEPLNYFVDPYAEADGVPVTATKEWSFKDLD